LQQGETTLSSNTTTTLGHPIRHAYLRELAEVLRKHRLAEEGLFPLGKDWVTRFLRRHPDLKSQVAKSMERARVEVTKEQILEWFRQYTEEIQKYGIYNMDESGEGHGKVESN
jgi:GGDEF domain-containing protein